MLIDRICSLIDGELVVRGKNREVVGFYAGDFLSHVMVKAHSGCALLTVMDNANVASVAVKCGLNAIILCEGVSPRPELTESCRKAEVNLITTEIPTFECAQALKEEF